MPKHAICSASGGKIWITCTPSARLALNYPDRSSVYADEGTLAHKLAEWMIRLAIGLCTKQKFELELMHIKKHTLYGGQEMYDHCKDFKDFVLEQYSAALAVDPDAKLLLEQTLDGSEYVPEGFATTDVTILCRYFCHVIDLKYGKGIPVDAEENPQLKIYGIYSYSEFHYIYGFDKIKLSIFQPRLDNNSTWETSVADLLKWANDVLIPQAKKAFAGTGDFVPGEHCRFCKVKPCRANAEYNMILMRHEFAKAEVLTDNEVSEILEKIDLFRKWLSGIEDYALDMAVSKGKQWPGLKLVRGLSKRFYLDESAIYKNLIKLGYEPKQILQVKLLGLTKMKSLTGKNIFAEAVEPYTKKPEGAPTLVPVTDDRAPIGAAEVKKMFDDLENL